MLVVKEYSNEPSAFGWADLLEKNLEAEKKLGLHPETSKPKSKDWGRVVKSPSYVLGLSFKVPDSVALVHVLHPDKNLLQAVEKSVRDGLTTFTTKFNGMEPIGQLFQGIQTLDMKKTLLDKEGKPLGLPVPKMTASAFIPLDKEAPSQDFKQRVKVAHRLLDTCIKSHLAFELRNVGYSVDRTPKGFELTGMDAEMQVNFNKAQALIQGESQPYQGGLSRLYPALTEAVSPDGEKDIQNLGFYAQKATVLSPEQVWKEAAVECFKNHDQVPLSHLQTQAVIKSIGSHLLPQNVLAEMPKLLTRNTNGMVMSTTPEIHQEWLGTVDTIRQSKGAVRPLKRRQLKELTIQGFKEVSPLQSLLNSSDRINVLSVKNEQQASDFLQQLKEELTAQGKSMEVLKPIAPEQDIFFNPATYRVERRSPTINLRAKQKAETKGETADLSCISNAGQLSRQKLSQALRQAQQYKQRLLLLQPSNQALPKGFLGQLMQRNMLPLLNQIGAARNHTAANDRGTPAQNISRGIVTKFASAIRAKTNKNTLSKGA